MIPDAEHHGLPETTPVTTAPLVQRIRLAVVGLFILGLFVQFYLAGRGASAPRAMRRIRTSAIFFIW